MLIATLLPASLLSSLIPSDAMHKLQVDQCSKLWEGLYWPPHALAPLTPIYPLFAFADLWAIITQPKQTKRQHSRMGVANLNNACSDWSTVKECRLTIWRDTDVFMLSATNVADMLASVKGRL